MKLILQTADVVSDAKNCRYPNRVSVMSAEELQAAVRFDHVCAEYKDNYRSVGNFIRSNVIVMDCDNDHSENPEEWITTEKMKKFFEDYSFAVAPSRHHMVPKDGKAARPKYHVYFEINETEDAEYYAALKRAIQKVYPFFEDNALDAARFIFGADCGEVCWHEGWNTIDEEVDVLAGTGDEDADDGSWRPDGKISQGTRNRTLSHFAGRALKRFGETEKAKKIFLEEAAKCDPPLDKEELKTIWHSALKFYRNTVQTQEGYVEPDEYNSDFRDESLKPGDYSDIGQAKALIKEYGGELRFSEATDFLRYDGQAWIEDKQYAVGALEEFLDLQLEDANDCVQRLAEALVTMRVDEETVKAGGKPLEKAVTGKQVKLFHAYIAARGYLAFVMKRRDWKYVASALNVAKPMILINVNSLDTDENLLNTPEATFDLKKGLDGGKPHDPADYITKCTACAPGEDGKKLWEDALDLFFYGDKSLIAYVQQIVGMAAVGRVYQEHLIIAYGSGANGKSTFWNTVARVMGTYSGKLSAETLTMSCKRNVKPEMAELKGRRLIISSEMQEGMRLNTSMVKQLCSTDEIFAEKKYKAPFAFSPSHTLVLYTNHLPKVGATDDGIWRRLIVIPFNAKIEGKNDIKNYSEFLFENAGAAIMAWIIEGAKKAIDMHFHTPLPKVVEKAIDAYREENNWLGRFLEECCEVGTSYREKSGEFYQQYRAYCMCLHASFQVEAGCCKRYTKEEKLNEAVWESVKKLLDLTDTVAEKVAQRKANAGMNQIGLAKELAELQRQLEKCNADRFANVDLFMAGKLEQDVYQSRRAELTRRVEDLEGRIRKTEEKLHEAETVRDDALGEALAQMKRFEDADGLSREMAEALIEKVVVYDPEHMEVVWKFSDEVMRVIRE